MRYPYTLSLKKTVSLHEDGGDLLLAGPQARGFRIAKPGAALKSLLANLNCGNMTADELCEAFARAENNADLARLYYTLSRIEKKGFVCHTLVSNGKKLATLEPISHQFRFDDATVQGTYRLSRFACLRLVESEILLESSLGHAQLVIHDALAAALIASLAVPRTVAELAKCMPDIEAASISAFMVLLVNTKAVFPPQEDGRIAEDDSVSLRQWEFHDLLFHTKSRAGRHENPLGGTYRFLNQLPPLPAVKPPMSQRRIALYQPDMKALDSKDTPFSRVLEARCSIRSQGEQPINAKQLGEFLYRTARVKAVNPAVPEKGALYESSSRPCAGGGAMHEIELYLTLARCDGIEPGFYHYDPLVHELEHLTNLGPVQERLLSDGCGAAGLKSPPDVLITLAARFQRVAWKYQSMAYAVMLKNTGVLYQQMYLVATALNLAPCGLGGGNSDLFAEASELDYYAETSVGEFWLSGRSKV